MNDSMNYDENQKAMNNSPLHEAVANRDLVEVMKLLAEGADVHARNSKGETPLHHVYDYKITQLLLAAGADVNARTHDDHTPLAVSIAIGAVPVIALLLQAGAHVNDKFETTYYTTALHLAVSEYCEKFEIVRLLIEAGADVNLQDAHGKTPLHIIMQHRYTNHNNRRIITLLLDCGADLSMQDNQGAAPLEYAHNLDSKLLGYIKKLFR